MLGFAGSAGSQGCWHLRVSRVVVFYAGALWMLVRSGCVGPRDGVPAFGGGEGWVGRPLDALADALSAQKLLFRVPAAAGGHRCAF